MSNPFHKKHLVKLNRVTGQVEEIKRIIDYQRYCVYFITQIKAARSALKS
ncbi:metal-sensing transcriptional repressor, partial [Francisella tularensis subsp. holarctica]